MEILFKQGCLPLLQRHLMTHSSCTGMLHKTKPERIRHYAQHLHSPLTYVTAQTDKDFNVDVPLLRRFWSGPAEQLWGIFNYCQCPCLYK